MKNYYGLSLYLLILISCIRHGSCDSTSRKKVVSCMIGLIKGTCMPFYNCKSGIFQRTAKCSADSNGLSVKCCANEFTLNPVEHKLEPVIDPTTETPLMKTGQKAWDQCLDYLRDVNYPCKSKAHSNSISTGLYNDMANNMPMIFGGVAAERSLFPHMALLGYGDEKKSIKWQCGGSLISEYFVLTAGHCIADTEGRNVSYVTLGILKMSDPPEMWHRYKVQRIIPHPDYKSPSLYNDIALLQTGKRIDFGPTVAPACLAIQDPPNKGINKSGYEGFRITGWGFIDGTDRMSDTLQMGTVNEVTDEECGKEYTVKRNMNRGLDNSTQACYGNKEHATDACGGDSGGPLQISGQASNCQHSIVAVTSFGSRCPTGKFGLYTKVHPYQEWIEKIVWP